MSLNGIISRDSDQDFLNKDGTVELTAVEVAIALKRILAVGAIACVCFGVYVTMLSLTIWSFHWHKSPQKSMRAQWVVWATGLLIVSRHIINMAGLVDICSWAQIYGVDYHDQSPAFYQSHVPILRYCGNVETFQKLDISSISTLVNLYIPPLVALLSDGVLAWRVFVVWNRPFWLQYILALALSVNFGMGLAVAIHLSQVTSHTLITYVNVRLDSDQDRFAIVYTSWAWMAFALNSTLSISVLLRIRHVVGAWQQGLGRYATLLRALIESAVISWLASFGSAVIWSIALKQYYSTPGRWRQGHNSVVNSFGVLIDGPLDWVSSVMFVALPYLLGMSQALIIMRVNMYKLQSPQHLAEVITGSLDYMDTWTDPCSSYDSEAGYFCNAVQDDLAHSTMTDPGNDLVGSGSTRDEGHPDTKQQPRRLSDISTDRSSTV